MVNAWELLLKAELVKHSGRSAVYYPNISRSLSLRDVLKKRMKENDPVRQNIEVLTDIRDDAVHLLIPKPQPEFSRLFQATVLNYSERYRKENGKHPLAGQSPGLLSLVIDGPGPEIAQIGREYGTETAERVKTFLDKFRKLERRHTGPEFAVGLEYKLVLTKKHTKSDIVLSVGSHGQDAVILEKPRDINKQFPYREKEAVMAIKENLTSDVKLTKYTFRAIMFKHNIRKANSQYHYKVDLTGTHLYSEELVEWVVEKVSKDREWLDRAVESYRCDLAKRRQSRAS